MKTILVTGGSRGIGLEFTRQYLAKGCQVFAASRKAEDSGDLQQLAVQHGDRLAAYPLDVADAGSRRDLFQALSARTEKLDLLINSAGVISGNEEFCYPLGELDQEDLCRTFLVNSIAPLMMVEGVLPFLIKGAPSIVVNLSSDNGSISRKNRKGKYGYSASKAALNMMTKILSVELREQGIIAVSLHPGWVQTTMTRKENAPLVRAATHQNPALRTRLFDEFELDGTARQLLVRMACGFDPSHLRPGDYLVRYPFSSVEAIRAGLEHLVEFKVVAPRGDGGYAVTELGERVVRSWMEKVSAMIQSLDLGDVPPADVQRLLDYDRRILAAIEASSRPHGHPIFNHRLRGLHPAHDPPELWHHWQLVWTMLAASEDEEEYVRQQRGMDPMVWFARRQIWFVHRRPWRARVKTLDDFVRRATGYSPIQHAEWVCSQAIAELQDRGGLETVQGEYRLTPEGLALCDEDEGEIDGYLTSCWPAFSDGEVDDLLAVTARLNQRFEELSTEA